MEKDLIDYIISHYHTLMTSDEKIAQRHIHSLVKLDGEKDTPREKMYIKRAWITKHQPSLDLIKNGEESFYEKTAKRIFDENYSQVYINNCPKCGKLARTPIAKQCRHCNNDWHKTDE